MRGASVGAFGDVCPKREHRSMHARQAAEPELLCENPQREGIQPAETSLAPWGALQASPKPKLRAFPSLGRNSLSPGEERGIWQGARLAAWHPELAASSRGWGRGVSRGTRCRENCWRGSRRAKITRSAIVTVLKKIQSREPSGSRAAAKRRGWRPRGVPTPSGDRGPGAARLAARRGTGGTTGQQRLLQVPGASALAAPRGLLRWNGLVPHPRFPLLRNPGSTRGKSPSRNGPDCPEKSESVGPCCHFLDPLAPLPAAPRPRKPWYRLGQSQLILPCRYKRVRKTLQGGKTKTAIL
ncbi:LOW QUALITY PROTEIN: uncharacterized protein MIR1915HG [Mustela putorius furo]|uniref:LOW QUALITY PROTEIN: uncharacterized protein MIR1915HG n=1 Tax=Mustela putorius furo TaxID=9669 RepID=A0A8U0SDQ4_MUSPF|nr:LOW QUALITY PROTEIN: uncharacterized protein MIR1915HG [Mustela putorius furo]